jgi:hypothetical protein
MNRLTPAKQAQVIAALVEGNSIRATVRLKERYTAPLGRYRACPARHTRIARYATCLAGKFSATKFGPSAMRSKRTSRKRNKGSLVSVMFGPGRLSVPIPS